MIHLDANFLVAIGRHDRRATQPLASWIAARKTIGMSSVAWSEFLCGPVTLEQTEVAHTFVARIEPFTADDAKLAAELFNATNRRSRSHADCMIAATAIRLHSALATLERSGFAPFLKHHLRLQSL